MTPAEEATFIALWNQGLTTAAIAARLDIPGGTARSRAYSLQQQGKITSRSKGGRRMPARQGGSPTPVHDSAEAGAVQATIHSAEAVQNSAVHAPLHGAQTVQSSADPPIPAAMAEEFRRLWTAIDAQRQEMHRPGQATVHDTVQSLPEPLFDDPADNATERWNLYLKHGLRMRIEALAQARGIAPSHVVQEILWTALADRQPSTPLRRDA